MPDTLLWILLLTAFTLLAIYFEKVDVQGGIVGFFLVLGIVLGTGILGFSLFATFFLLGTLATKWKIKEKHQLGLAEKNKGKRSAINAFANTSTATLLGLILYFFPENTSLVVALSSSLSAATADTLASELGNIYGKKYLNILTFQTDIRGLDGTVSLEGTLFGVAGSFLLATIFFFFQGDLMRSFIVFFAGCFGNYLDSVLGATLQRKKLVNNHTVNFLMTFGAALFALMWTQLQ